MVLSAMLILRRKPLGASIARTDVQPENIERRMG